MRAIRQPLSTLKGRRAAIRSKVQGRCKWMEDRPSDRFPEISSEAKVLLDEWVDHHHFEEIDSTQSYVEREHPSFNQEKLTAVSADFQSAGRGTGDRTWHGSKAQSILVSFFFRFPAQCDNEFVNSNAPNVTKVLAVAAVGSLQGATDQKLGIKWPNDIVGNGCKLGGILARAVPFNGRLEGIIVGIGINVNTSQEELDRICRPVWPAASLWTLRAAEPTSPAGRSGFEFRPAFDVPLLRQMLLANFAVELKRFFRGGFSVVRDRVNHLEVLMGTKVWFRAHEADEFQGVFEGIQDDGLILLRLESGEVKAFPSGEIIPAPTT